LYENVLRPFLRGVFLAELESVDSSYGREMMRSFIVGDSGLPSAGAGTLSEALAARIATVHLNAAVDSLAQFDGKKIILATDAATTARLLGTQVESKFVDSYTWYHSLPAGVISTSHLRVTSTANPIVNSVAISNFAPQYAPEGRTLISSSALTSLSDEAALIEIAKFWGIAPSEFELVKRYEIRNSLPLFEPGKSSVTTNPKVDENIYLAGDYLTSGSQNGALLSGRLAALELLLDKS
jgi:hypothetical protein